MTNIVTRAKIVFFVPMDFLFSPIAIAIAIASHIVEVRELHIC